jgi:hypothetical protein
MTMPPTKLLVAWALGILLVSGSVPGQAAAPVTTSVTTSPKGQVIQKPATSGFRSPATTLLAAPATTEQPGDATAAAVPAEAAAPSETAMTASQARSALERGMTELGELASRARQSGDMLRIACVQDKQDRAGAVMEVATGDMLVVQDPAADAQTRAFAGEKLGESAQQMNGLVGQARACQGKEEAASGNASNDVKTPQGVLPQDPTGGGPPGPRGLPPIDPRPPVASPVL